MKTWRALLRAEYWWQPAQLPRRAWRALARGSARGRVLVRLPWDFPLSVDPHESIGRSIFALNTLDLPVTEAIWRLLEPGETAADVGANLGYMTSVMAARLRAGGAVHAFEPVPELAARLREHVAQWSALGRATIDVHEIALSDAGGEAELHLPDEGGINDGLASLAAPGDESGARRLRVRTRTLDEFFSGTPPPQVMKVDVEGCEARVFHGGAQLFAARKIRDVIFEELQPLPAESVRLMQAHGYTVFRIARGWARPRLVAPEEIPWGELDPPSFLATADPVRAQARFERIGWQALRGRDD